MDWQLIAACFAVALAGGYVCLRGWRVLRASKGACSGGCGCAKSETKTPAIIAPEQLVLRQRPTQKTD